MDSDELLLTPPIRTPVSRIKEFPHPISSNHTYFVLCGEDRVLAIAVSFLVETQGGASPHRPHLQSFDTSGKNGLHFSMKS